MFHVVKGAQGVKKGASENGPLGSSEEAPFFTVTLALRERTSFGVARTRGRLAAGYAAGQIDRFSDPSEKLVAEHDRCPAPDLTRTAERA